MLSKRIIHWINRTAKGKLRRSPFWRCPPDDFNDLVWPCRTTIVTLFPKNKKKKRNQNWKKQNKKIYISATTHIQVALKTQWKCVKTYLWGHPDFWMTSANVFPTWFHCLSVPSTFTPPHLLPPPSRQRGEILKTTKDLSKHLLPKNDNFSSLGMQRIELLFKLFVAESQVELPRE